MVATVISVGIQKGGVGKSTTSSILAYALSQDHKVLAVDMDGQGNFTQLLTGTENLYEFKDHSICEVILEQDATPYRVTINDNLHVICGSEDITTLNSHFYLELNRHYHYVLKNALGKVADEYDYIIIDNPPALGELSVISLTASDFVLIMFETGQWCYNSLLSYLKTIEETKKHTNTDLKIAGILRSMIDGRRTDNKYFSDLVEKEFSEYVFKTIIKRNADIGKLPALGLIDNPDINKVMKHYRPFLKEIKGLIGDVKQL